MNRLGAPCGRWGVAASGGTPAFEAQGLFYFGGAHAVVLRHGCDAAFRYEQQGKVGLFYWIEEGAGYALVGELPKETLLALAQAIYQQHPGPMPAPAPAPPASTAKPAAKPG